MLSTKDMSAGSGSIKPVIGVGNHKVKINSISFDQTPYDSEAYNVTLHVESEPVTGEFNGFYIYIGIGNQCILTIINNHIHLGFGICKLFI